MVRVRVAGILGWNGSFLLKIYTSAGNVSFVGELELWAGLWGGIVFILNVMGHFLVGC